MIMAEFIYLMEAITEQADTETKKLGSTITDKRVFSLRLNFFFFFKSVSIYLDVAYKKK